MRSRPLGALFFSAIFSCGFSIVAACVGDTSPPPPGDASLDACSTGSESCPCTTGGACNPGLTCLSKVCVQLDAGGSDSATDAASPDSADSTADVDDAAQTTCGVVYPSDGSTGPFCPYQKDGSAPCAVGETCCELLGDASTCGNGSCSGVAWQCQDRLQCPSNDPICCATITVTPTDPDCGTGFVPPQNVSGATCATSCSGANEYTVCARASDCPTNKTCTSLKTLGLTYGVCL